MSTRPIPAAHSSAGMLEALLAYGIWGVAPVFWKLLQGFSAAELLAWRVLASCAVGALLVALAGGRADVLRLLRSARALAAVALAALLIGINWLVFIHAVQTGRILETSLGYYINPLVNVFFGLVLLRERLTRAQWIALVLAAGGVALQGWHFGELPWISLVLAASFALYGLVRKLAPAAPLAGFWVETALLVPVALVYLGRSGGDGAAALVGAESGTQALVLASGLVTALPLVAFASAARKLPLSLLGMFQYLAPTLSFALAVGLYGERFRAMHLLSFGCVWAALGLFVWDALQRRSRAAECVR